MLLLVVKICSYKICISRMLCYCYMLYINQYYIKTFFLKFDRLKVMQYLMITMIDRDSKIFDYVVQNTLKYNRMNVPTKRKGSKLELPLTNFLSKAKIYHRHCRKGKKPKQPLNYLKKYFLMFKNKLELFCFFLKKNLFI